MKITRFDIVKYQDLIALLPSRIVNSRSTRSRSIGKIQIRQSASNLYTDPSVRASWRDRHDSVCHDLVKPIQNYT
jgi:hypothetical protein